MNWIAFMTTDGYPIFMDRGMIHGAVLKNGVPTLLTTAGEYGVKATLDEVEEQLGVKAAAPEPWTDALNAFVGSGKPKAEVLAEYRRLTCNPKGRLRATVLKRCGLVVEDGVVKRG